ncbi:MAG: helix-turn-helix domain-containing protein [Eubacteriales bacterium]|nr:helix-turn-helix domain-containing protein [Eubacteriales bacterium]
MVRRLSAEDRKREIREAARQVFLEKSYVRTTMEDIAERAGLSKGGLYRHYASKVEILHDLMEEGTDYRSDVVNRFLEECQGLSFVDMIVETLMRKLFDENPYKQLYAMFLIEAEHCEELRVLRDRVMAEGTRHTRTLLEERGYPNLSFMFSPGFVEFVNSTIVSAYLLHNGEFFLNDSNLYRDMLRRYIEVELQAADRS